MAFSKSDQYTQAEQSLADLGMWIKHPARQRIVGQLSKEICLTVGEIAKNHPICGSTLSQHLGILLSNNYIHYTEVYPFTYYSVNREEVSRARDLINRYFDALLEGFHEINPGIVQKK